MQATYSEYDFNKSIERINEVLDNSDSSYEDVKSIPSRDTLTFGNGFYVGCSVLYVDIRGSTELTSKHTRPVLAKIYKTYISELVAVLKGHSKVNEIYIEGDAVWGVFDTPNKADVDELFSIGARVSSLVDILNIKYKKKGYSELKVGIGIADGSALLIKAGYKGSGINEVVWLGKVVAEAALLCSYGNKTYTDSEMMVSNIIYDNLNDANKKLLSKNYSRDCYHGEVINTVMDAWVQKNGKN
ncbi:MAG: adenylate/guanylate cyclase domain-containing protein [Sulfuricurvum sp.]|nr:adenylate/guanylate cyclase domain-containing protein [Sulfuricurvum sp.]